MSKFLPTMETIEIRQVNSRKEMKLFVGFPFRLYHGNPFWCPPLKCDEIKTLSQDKNPAFEFCEASYWMAFRQGAPVGRIAGIINYNEAACWGESRMRFGWIDFIDDLDVSSGLIRRVIEWGRKKGMTRLHGPLGFTNMDAAGMLIDGFDEISAMSTIYNYPYYGDHMQTLGFRRAVDWIQHEIKIPSEVPEKVERLTKLVVQKYNLRLLKPHKKNDIAPYAKKMFDLYNIAFRDLYGFTPLTVRQMDYYISLFMGFIQPEFISMVIDQKDNVAGFAITMPSLSNALKKANGKLYPFGFIYLLQGLRNNDRADMCLIGVDPVYHGKGLVSLMLNDLNRSFLRAGITMAWTHPQLEQNLKAISIWKQFNPRINTRRRCWVLDF